MDDSDNDEVIPTSGNQTDAEPFKDITNTVEPETSDGQQSKRSSPDHAKKKAILARSNKNRDNAYSVPSVIKTDNAKGTFVLDKSSDKLPDAEATIKESIVKSPNKLVKDGTTVLDSKDGSKSHNNIIATSSGIPTTTNDKSESDKQTPTSQDSSSVQNKLETVSGNIPKPVIQNDKPLESEYTDNSKSIKKKALSKTNKNINALASTNSRDDKDKKVNIPVVDITYTGDSKNIINIADHESKESTISKPQNSSIGNVEEVPVVDITYSGQSKSNKSKKENDIDKHSDNINTGDLTKNEVDNKDDKESKSSLTKTSVEDSNRNNSLNNQLEKDIHIFNKRNKALNASSEQIGNERQSYKQTDKQETSSRIISDVISKTANKSQRSRSKSPVKQSVKPLHSSGPPYANVTAGKTDNSCDTKREQNTTKPPERTADKIKTSNSNKTESNSGKPCAESNIKSDSTQSSSHTNKELSKSKCESNKTYPNTNKKSHDKPKRALQQQQDTKTLLEDSIKPTSPINLGDTADTNVNTQNDSLTNAKFPTTSTTNPEDLLTDNEKSTVNNTIAFESKTKPSISSQIDSTKETVTKQVIKLDVHSEVLDSKSKPVTKGNKSKTSKPYRYEETKIPHSPTFASNKDREQSKISRDVVIKTPIPEERELIKRDQSEVSDIVNIETTKVTVQSATSRKSNMDDYDSETKRAWSSKDGPSPMLYPSEADYEYSAYRDKTPNVIPPPSATFSDRDTRSRKISRESRGSMVLDEPRRYRRGDIEMRKETVDDTSVFGMDQYQSDRYEDPESASRDDHNTHNKENTDILDSMAKAHEESQRVDNMVADFKARISAIEEENKRLIEDNTRLLEKVRSVEDREYKLRQENMNLLNKVNELNRIIDTQNNSSDENSLQLVALSNKLHETEKILASEQKHSKKEKELLDNEIERLKQKVKSKEEELKTTTQSFQNQVNSLEKEIAELLAREKLQSSELSDQTNSLNTKLLSVRAELESLKTEHMQVKSDLIKRSRTDEEVESEINGLSSDNKLLVEQKSNADNEIQELKTKIADLEALVALRDEEIENLKDSIEDMVNKLNVQKLNEKPSTELIEEKQAHIQSLQDEIADLRTQNTKAMGLLEKANEAGFEQKVTKEKYDEMAGNHKKILEENKRLKTQLTQRQMDETNTNAEFSELKQQIEDKREELNKAYRRMKKLEDWMDEIYNTDQFRSLVADGDVRPHSPFSLPELGTSSRVDTRRTSRSYVTPTPRSHAGWGMPYANRNKKNKLR